MEKNHSEDFKDMKKLILFASIIGLIQMSSCNSSQKTIITNKHKFINTKTELKEIDIDTAISGKKFYGRIQLNDQTKNDNKILEIELFNLLENKIPDYINSKLIYRKKTYNYSFIISNDDLKKYTMLSFKKGIYDTIIPISKLNSENDTIILNKKFSIIARKPVIYLYPTKKEKIIIEHKFKGKILCTYPIYKNNWEVVAYPNGKIFNLRDKRFYNYLFWEGKIQFNSDHYFYKDGYIVEKNNIINFLQEKLEKIGLNNVEINDFITYWLPELNKKNYYFIHFRINDNIDNTSFLKVSPKADTVIRVFMEFKGYDNLKDITYVNEQKLKNIPRKGFLMVEWGGTEIKNYRQK